MSEVQESENALGTGRLLILFFGLVVLCAVFFAFGFTLGRNSGTSQAATNVPIETSGEPLGAPKPAAGKIATLDGCPAGQDCSPTNDELTFYKAVEQKEPDVKLVPAIKTAIPAPSKVEINAAPESPKRALAGGFTVQVAAVSKKEDADALAGALRKKQYPVFTTTNLPVDKLIRVQIGPFANVKDAETIRTRLRSDGYNPIVKK